MAPLDDRLLAEAREAQTAQAHAQAEAELARVRFVDAVRRLHAGGGSMREIGRAFGLSHQRVHQIVTGATGSVQCSFCGADHTSARRLIAGPGVYVCDGCVVLAGRVVGGDPAAEQEWAGTRAPWAEADGDGCSFCGKRQEQVTGMVAAAAFRICRECLDLCDEIIAEELGEG